jgi:hypothetical protein
LIAEARGYVDQGFKAIKLKVGGISGGFSVEDDYQRVKAVREALGPNIKLMLDANQGWDVPTAIRASNRMYDLDIVSDPACVRRARTDALGRTPAYGDRSHRCHAVRLQRACRNHRVAQGRRHGINVLGQNGPSP